jgi:hypothetical protein
LRIVGIDDSVMFGWGVDEHDTYLASSRARPPFAIVRATVRGLEPRRRARSSGAPRADRRAHARPARGRLGR